MNEYEHVMQKYGVTLLDEMPFRVRDASRHKELIELIRELGYKVGAEVGVEQGKYSEQLCYGNPELKLYCIDPWLTYNRYADIQDQAKMERYFSDAQNRLGKYNCEIIRKTSMDAVADFEPESLDFVYIDGNHDFEFVVNDIIQWAKIVRHGGMLAGHDYRPEGRERIPIPFHIIQATHAYTDCYKVKPWYIMTGDSSPSWFWIKK